MNKKELISAFSHNNMDFATLPKDIISNFSHDKEIMFLAIEQNISNINFTSLSLFNDDDFHNFLLNHEHHTIDDYIYALED